MKKYIFIATSLFFVCTMSAQNVFDAMMFGETTLTGTARYMGMGGAFGALGGDPTAILDNPGGLGIYRGSELTFTIDFLPSVSYTNWSRKTTENDFRFDLNNLSYVLSVPSGRDKGYLCSNFSFIYNRRRDFSRKVRVMGNSDNSITDYMARNTDGLFEDEISFTNAQCPYLSVLGYQSYLINPVDSNSNQWLSLLNEGEGVTAGYHIVESGYIDDYNFAYATNINNFIYLGVGVTLQSLYYSKNAYYAERFDEGGSMQLKNSTNTSGVGWNFKFGFIIRPTSFMRVGFSLQTPTYYSLTDSYVANTTSTIGNNNYYIGTPSESFDYDYRTPFRLQASLAFVIQKQGLIGVEYNYIDYKNSVRYSDNDGNGVFQQPFDFENYQIKTYGKKVHAIKVGGEVRISTQFAVRAGGAYFSPSTSNNAALNLLNNTTRTSVSYFVNKGTYYVGGGVGYRYNGFSADLSYQFRSQMEGFAPYQSNAALYQQEIDGTNYGLYGSTQKKSVQVSDVKTNYHNVVVTLSYKF